MQADATRELNAYLMLLRFSKNRFRKMCTGGIKVKLKKYYQESLIKKIGYRIYTKNCATFINRKYKMSASTRKEYFCTSRCGLDGGINLTIRVTNSNEFSQGDKTLADRSLDIYLYTLQTYRKSFIKINLWIKK